MCVKAPSFKKPNPKLVRDIAKKMGLMSKHLLRLKKEGLYTWSEHQFRPHPSLKGKILGLDMKAEEGKTLLEMRKIDRKKLRRTVIHGDFHGNNLLVKANKLVAIIDWDDCHEDYLVQELSVFLMDLCASKGKLDKKRLKDILKEYQKGVKLRLEEKKAVYHFVKRRFFGVILWHSKQMKIHKEFTKKLRKNQSHIVRKYIEFNKLSLEEFLKLF
jgi:Ser/Thr protein kinase RdoA (MazF antagonist)